MLKVMSLCLSALSQEQEVSKGEKLLRGELRDCYILNIGIITSCGKTREKKI
jgi:hypothetical protein